MDRPSRPSPSAPPSRSLLGAPLRRLVLLIVLGTLGLGPVACNGSSPGASSPATGAGEAAEGGSGSAAEGSDRATASEDTPEPREPRDPGEPAPVPEPPPGTYTTLERPSRDGIGKVYRGREISQVMGHRGARWLERSSRLEEERPDLLLEALELCPGQAVADVGAGSGYFALPLARLVGPEGTVYGVDIQPEMLALLAAAAAEAGVDNVVPVRGAIDDPRLPPESVDLALMVDAYHEFSHPWEMVHGLVEALRPGGRLVFVEYRAEDPSVAIKPLHKMSEAQVRREMEPFALRWVETLDLLPLQHVIVFEKRAGEPAETRREP